MLNLLINILGVFFVTFLGFLFIMFGLFSIKSKRFKWGKTNYPYENKYPSLKTDKTLHVNLKGGQAIIHGILFLILGLLTFAIGLYTIIYSILSYFGKTI